MTPSTQTSSPKRSQKAETKPKGPLPELDMLQVMLRDSERQEKSMSFMSSPFVAKPKARKAAAARAMAANLTPSMSFANVYQAAPLQRIGVVKAGVVASMIDDIAAALSTTSSFVITILGLKRSTVARKKADPAASLSTEDSERLVGLARLVGQVEVMVRESGNSVGFDSGKWLAHWLDQPLGALNGEKPAAYMDTAEGQALVSSLLLQIQHGTYA
jgi:putative toxin-antitoxin system antitoxin component (TIGR02293 family)